MFSNHLSSVKWLVICLPLWSCCETKADSSNERQRPNIVLIMADDMGFESLRCNGGTSYDSTILDDLASEGMRFTNCYSQPICTPSRNKIMTGRSNARNYRRFGLLIREELTFGNLLQSVGYKTCVAGKWQLTGGGTNGATPQSCGFDQSCMWAYLHNLPEGVQHTGGWERENVTSRFWHPSILQNGNYRPTSPNDYGPDIYTQFIIDFIEKNKEENFFAYYPMTLTHGPFVPTPFSKDHATAEKFKSQPKYFGDMIAYTGHCVRRIIDALIRLKIAEDTLVLFTADNGTHRNLTSMVGERIVPGGKGLTLDAGCHVPMFAYWKGKVAAGSVCHDLIDFSDFFPTIAELANAELPTDRTIDGMSFVNPLYGRSPTDRQKRSAVFVHYDKSPASPNPQFRRTRFAYDGMYKLYQDGTMFQIAHDWGEEHPLDPAQDTELRRASRTALQSKLDAMPRWDPDNTKFGNGPDPPTVRWRERANPMKVPATEKQTR